MKHEIRFVLNGEERSLEVEANLTLLQLLRDRLHVTSPKRSCEQGECGACTVILNGKAVNACLVLAVTVNGKAVETVDSLGKDELHPLQKHFKEVAASQCGYCTPRHDHGGQGPPRCQPGPHLRASEGRSVGEHVPVHRVCQARGSGAGGRPRDPRLGFLE